MTVHELSRRSALRGLTVMASAAVVGYVVSRNSDAVRTAGVGTAANGYGASVTGRGLRLAGVDDVPAGGGLILADQQIVLTRGVGESIQAFSAICTHQGCPVNRVADGTINCPCHGSRFDVRTGAVVSGPAPRPLPAVAVTVHDGSVYTA